MGAAIVEGSIVVNPLKTDWEPGKVVRVVGDKAYVFFRDHAHAKAKRFSVGLLEHATVQEDEILENLAPFIEQDGDLVLPAERVSGLEAREKFLDRFPGGFVDPNYIGTSTTGERTYKVDAHLKFKSELGDGKGKELLSEGKIADLASRAVRVVNSVNLLFSIEFAAFREGLGHEQPAARYFALLFELLEVGPQKESFEAYLSALRGLPTEGGMDTDKWTTATVLPFLADPSAFMFLKPSITTTAAERLGFDLKYSTQPNWQTYEALLTMSRIYGEKLKDIGARDFIDVQSFFWLTSELFEELEAIKDD